jgi:2-oxoglutarate ferredoxin oxidoreductase subunit alpha
MAEAIEVLASENTHLDTLRLCAFPFPGSVANFIAEHQFVFVVEQNRDAQMRSLLINEFGIDPAKLFAILHYDGTPITARFIVSAISSQIEKLYIASMQSQKVITP